jgi:hypothetical protein
MANCILLTGGMFNQDEWSKGQRSVGPYRIATELEDAGFTTFVFDYVVNFTTEEIKQVLDQHLGEDTLWVGFSSTFYWFPPKNNTGKDILKFTEMWWTDIEEVNSIIRYIKESSSAKIIYGGTKSEYFIGANPLIDLYVVGLADTAIVPLTHSIKNNEYSSLPHYEEHVCEDGTVCYWVDCRKFPEPTMDKIQTKWWLPHFNMLPGEATSIEFARGCIFKCKFCTYPLLGKKKGTYLRAAMEIRDDMMRNYDAYGTTSYFITDDTVNDDTDKLRDIRDAIATLPFKPNLSGFFRLDLINRFREQSDLILDMGVNGVFFGIETLHPESAKSIGKGLHPKKVLDTLSWLATDKWKGRVNIGGGIILGLPHDTMDYFEELIEMVAKPDFPMHNVQFYPLHLNKIVPGKKLGLYVSEFNLNPEIYGYEFSSERNHISWELPSQGLSYTLVNEIAKEFNITRFPFQKIAGFEMQKYANIGISIDDLHNLNNFEITKKYNIIDLNEKWLAQYRSKLGINSVK